MNMEFEEKQQDDPEILDEVRYLEAPGLNPVRVELSDGTRGTLLWQEGEDNLEMVERLIGHMETWEAQGDSLCPSVCQPDRCLRLPEDRTGVVVTSNLGACANGMFWMLDPRAPHMQYDDGFAGVCRCLGQFAAAIADLAKKCRCYFTSWDCHQVFFQLSYKVTMLIPDGVGMTIDSEPGGSPLEHLGNDAVSVLLLYAFTGALPDRDQLPVGISGSGLYLEFPEGQTEPEGTEEVLARWYALPAWLRNLLRQANTQPGSVSAGDWSEKLLSIPTETARCPHCGKEHPADAERCVFCGKTVIKQDLQARFRVVSQQEPSRFTLIFGRGIQFCGENLSGSLPAGPLMQIVYNKKKNLLGLRNLGNTIWQASDPNGDEQVKPREILELRESLVISPGPGVQLAFLGYEE